MSVVFTVFEAVAHLSDAWIGLVLLAKWTLLLSLAWLAHAALARRNPRWRVALWRGAVLGVAMIGVLALVPPIVRYPIGPAVPRHPIERRESLDAQPRVEPPNPTTIVSPPEPPRTMRPVTIAPVTGTELGSAPTGGTRPPEPVPAPAPRPAAESWLSRGAELARSWAPSIWLAGMLVLTARLFLAGSALARLVRRCSDAPEGVVRECQAIAGQLGCNRSVRVVCSAEVATPCLAGSFRLVLLLPSREDRRPNELRAILAHELAHARHHDLAWNLAAHLASIALWFHPLAWRIRAAHAAACDAVSDAVAADYLGDVASYGRTLARLAVEASAPAPAYVLAMARTSEVWQRLDALNRMVFRSPLPRRQAWPALGIGGVLLVLVGGFGVGRAGQESDRKPAPARRGLALRAVEAATGEPIQGMAISYEGTIGEQPREGTLVTDKDGRATLEYPSGAVVKKLQVKAASPKHIPIFLSWDRGGRPIELPASKELRFQPGTVIGGIVKDQAGRPIAGATIVRSIPPTERDGAWAFWSFRGPKTDDRGRWRMEEAPANLADVYVKVDHPDYHTGHGPASRNLESVIALRKGYPVRGRVVDPGGRPVPGARVVIGASSWDGELPSTKTDARGDFVLERCAEEATVVTVQAAGFAPQVRDVKVDARTAPLSIRLEPASVLRLKVLDVAGKPVAGAFVFAQTWRGYHTLDLRSQTDPDGRFTWSGAPGDVVLYDVGKSGFMARRRIPLIASGREQVIVLHPILAITGRVTDAETGRPLPECLIVQGVGFRETDQIFWSRNSAVRVKGGAYTTRFDEPNDTMFVRAEAVGYEPAVSRAFRPEEGAQRFDFALKRTETISGIVQRPDGKPAEGTDVILATETDQVLIEKGRVGGQTTAPRVRTGADGRFAFTAPDGPFLLIALGDAGYADATSMEFAMSGKLVLQPWGRLAGEVLVGGKPKSNEEITFSPDRPGRVNLARVLIHQYTAETDAHGRFRFDRVPSGPGIVARSLVTDFGRFTQHMTVQNRPVNIPQGGVATVRFARKGRPVVGRVVLDGATPRPVDWTHNPPAYLARTERGDGQEHPDDSGGTSNLDRDGRFRFEDVAEGTYEFGLSVAATFEHREHDFRNTEIARARVVLPRIPADPFDVGTITVKPLETLRAGELAPDFKVPRLAGRGNGDDLKLADYRGKLVVVDFWFPSCSQCRAESVSLKEIPKTIRDPRLAIISLACGQPADRAIEVIRDAGLTWTHGLASGPGAGVIETYKVRSIPSTFLVGPDGRILAKDLRGAALTEAITRALGSKDDAKEK